MQDQEFRERLARAIDEEKPLIRMQAELWGCGLTMADAEFVAGQLARNGFYLVRPDDIEWQDIDAFNAELRRGQAVDEDAGGFMVRCIMRMFRVKTRTEIETYRDAAKRLLESVEA